MKETVTVQISKSVGYSGKNSGKSYIAKIVGTDKQYIFCREFVDTDAIDKAEMFKCRRKGKGTWVEAAAIEVGLYERSSLGERSFLCVWLKDGVVSRMAVSEDRAIAMACRMDDGETSEEARIATKPPRKDAEVLA